MAAIPELLGLSISEGVAFALGLAMGPALEPLTQEIKNESWSSVVARSNGDISKPLEVGDLAAIVAESVEALNWGRTEARKTGIRQEDFDALFHAEQDAPGFGTLLQLLRRGLINAGDFEHGLRKAKFEGRWDTGLEALREVLLSPADLAMMRQQGFIAPARQHSESELQGVNAERADLLFEASGLPPGIETALEMLRRSIVDAATFAQIVREGHTKTKYTDELLALRDRVLSATEYATLHLKGHITAAAMVAGGALTGYDAEAMNLLYLARGRPATTHQIHIGYARGGTVPGAANEEEAIRQSVERSDIRPEYFDVLYASRYSLPSPFVMRSLTSSGVWTEEKAALRLRQAGWIPGDADEAAAAWSATTDATKPDTHAAKAQTQLWTALHSAYMAGDATDATVTEKLPQAGVAAATVPKVLATWKHEREIVRQRITPAQLKKALGKAVKNPVTGVPWTKDEVLAELLARGWNTQDANTFLDT